MTELAVARITPPKSGRLEVWDLVLPAFGVRVSHTGKRVWMVAVRRPGTEHPTRIKLGTFPPMALADARAKARAIMAGGAPGSPVRFGEMVEVFLQHARTKRGRPLRQKTVDQYRRALNGSAASLHRRPIQGLTRREVATLIGSIATRSGAPTASLVRAMLARLLGWDWDLHDAGALDHPVGPITEACDLYDYLPEKGEALQAWADELDRIVTSS